MIGIFFNSSQDRFCVVCFVCYIASVIVNIRTFYLTKEIIEWVNYYIILIRIIIYLIINNYFIFYEMIFPFFQYDGFFMNNCLLKRRTYCSRIRQASSLPSHNNFVWFYATNSTNISLLVKKAFRFFLLKIYLNFNLTILAFLKLFVIKLT